MANITINRPLKPTKKRKKKIEPQKTPAVITRGGVKNRRLSAREKARRKTARTYERLIKKLDLYGQAPLHRIERPQTRDVKRLQTRLETIHQYDIIYRRYERSIRGFNEKYLQDIKLPQPHTRITTQTLSILNKKYEDWKRYRHNFVRRIANEPENIIRQLKGFIKDSIDFISPNPYTGQYTANEERIIGNAGRLADQILEEWIPKDPVERAATLRRIKRNWRFVTEQMMIVIYDSDQRRRAQAYAMLYALITGDGTRKGQGFDFDVNPREEEEYA